MADDGSAQGATWPMPKFRFEVDLGTELKGVGFQEVSGMDVENQVIEYRKSNSPLFSPEKMPGLVKYGNVTMKRGIFVNDNVFWDWHAEIKMNLIKRRTVLIKLLDESGNVTMQWQLDNAWPTKISSTDLKSEGNEVAIDTLEIAHEQLTITNGQ
ncbi:phage tail protein [Pedobacter gandavensis]|uniref:phage tail protein n=1 Tax=Pedobacter gandavensis TaxID=2679963 RepID=UPI00292D208D|nr:phage tail protein [Pedobacter gandavensis]